MAEEKKEPVTFASLGVDEQFCEQLEKIGWKKPTDIQREALPPAFEGMLSTLHCCPAMCSYKTMCSSHSGRDIIGFAETGSGKTGAFALPVLQALLKAPQKLFGLVLAPTRFVAFPSSS